LPATSTSRRPPCTSTRTRKPHATCCVRSTPPTRASQPGRWEGRERADAGASEERAVGPSTAFRRVARATTAHRARRARRPAREGRRGCGGPASSCCAISAVQPIRQASPGRRAVRRAMWMYKSTSASAVERHDRSPTRSSRPVIAFRGSLRCQPTPVTCREDLLGRTSLPQHEKRSGAVTLADTRVPYDAGMRDGLQVRSSTPVRCRVATARRAPAASCSGGREG
jgi:hypothetical protein